MMTLALMTLASPAHAAPMKVVQDFSLAPGEDRTGGWSFGANDEIRTRGANNAYLHGSVDTCCLSLSSKGAASNPWVGDRNYRDLGVLGLRISTAGTTDFPGSVRDMGVLLINDNDTPLNTTDDWGMYTLISADYPFDGSPARFDFPIPSQDTNPADWKRWSNGGPLDFSWTDVITDVDEIRFLYHDPELFYIFQFHDVSVDNITLVYDPAL